MTAPDRSAAPEPAPRSPEDGFFAFRKALREFFARSLRRSRRTRTAVIDDLMQDTYEQLRRWPSRADIDDIEGYVFTCARNVLNQFYGRDARRQQRFVSYEDLQVAQHTLDVSSLWAAPDDADQEILLEEIDRAFAQLPGPCRIAFIRKLRDGWTYAEIAQELTVSEARVKQHIVRALAHFRVYFAMRPSVQGTAARDDEGTT